VNAPKHFQLRPGYGYFSPAGEVSLQEAINLIGRSIACCADQGVRKLLINAAGLSGFEPPTLADRFFLAIEFTEMSRGLVCVALVVRADLIHPEKFGVMVARNRGFVADVFVGEAEAGAWLDALDLS